MSSPKYEDLLELIGHAPRGAQDSAAPASAEEIDVPRLLSDLAAGTAPLDDRGRAVLERLCRKISVAKRVFRAYRSDWRKAPEAEPLGAHDWSLLIAVLLTHARPPEPEDHGLALAVKFLSSALDAVDLVRESGNEIPHLESLRRWSGELLDSLAAATGAAP